MTTATGTIPVGYKQTEVGVIPTDWSCIKLPDTTLPSSNSIKIGPFGSALKKEYLTKKGYKVYGQENVYEKDMSIGDRFLSSARFRDLKSCEIVPSDFLVSMMGTVGKCVIVPDGIEQGIMDSHLLRIKFDDSKIERRFVSQLFETKIIFDQIKQLSVGGIMEGLSSKIIKSIYFPLPPTKQEQLAIATALSDVDQIIRKLEKFIQKKKNIKKGAMQELLTGKRRLPGFSEKWETKKLGDIFRVTRGQVLAMTKTTEESMGEYQYPVYSSQTKNSGLAGFYKDYLFENCITWTTDGANAGDVKYRAGKFYCTNVCGVLENNNGYSNLCVAAIFNSISKKYVSYVGNPKLMNNVVADIEISLPASVKEQIAISKILTVMDAEIDKIESQLAKYRNIKIGMMQNLLTGKIRLIKKIIWRHNK
jgi:type I restriction enzyme S subunit